MIIDLINKKRLKGAFCEEEIQYMIQSYMNGMITDYQMSSLLMAICINGMTEDETYYLTKAFIQSGRQLDLHVLGEALVDKHSTGGVGDKVTFIVLPLVAACDVKVAKMSGRGLGYTGGTIDKFESIEGFRVELNNDEFMKQMTEIGCAITTSSADLVPADKKIYALRDVTGTVASIPLIASSIMSKKIAMGSKKIVLDVKVGRGAFFENIGDAEQLAQTMILIGKRFGVKVKVILSTMDSPLGYAVGNGLEVKEAIQLLKNQGSSSLKELSIEMASQMVALGKEIKIEDARNMVLDALTSGKALLKFMELIQYQGGNINHIAETSNKTDIYASKRGYIVDIDARKIAEIVLDLGAGRRKKEDSIDYGVGILFHKQIGDFIQEGDLLVTIYGHTNKNVLDAIYFGESRTNIKPIIYKIIE